MAIRILPENEIQQKASQFQQPALLFPNPKNLYQRRAERLRKLAENHPFTEYLQFVVHIVESQLNLLETQPQSKDDRLNSEYFAQHLSSIQPLNTSHWQRDNIWQDYLEQILQDSKTHANEQILATIEWLEKASKTELDKLADSLLAQQYHEVSSDKAVFIWAALSLYWLQLAAQMPHSNVQENNENLHYCPVCGSAPVASVVQVGSTQGLRYLHCSLCETEWNMVRAQCTNCHSIHHLDYWGIDQQQAAVQAESCGDCHSYLKSLYQEKDPYVDAVADDLASIFLDIEMEEKGFAKSGINPFMFPSGNE